MEEVILEYILTFVHDSSTLVVGINGPQGCGKSTVTRNLAKRLHGLGYEAVGISLDDYYLPRQEIKLLSERYGPPYHHRGVPGTHDTILLYEHIQQMRCAALSTIKLPVYDKFACDGEGDRIGWREIKLPVRVVIVEGWMLGFHPVAHPTNMIINENLTSYLDIWKLIDIWVLLRISNLVWIKDWRYEQEVNDAMALDRYARSRDQVDDFVKTFMPSYHDYYTNLPYIYPSALCLTIDHNREPLNK